MSPKSCPIPDCWPISVYQDILDIDDNGEIAIKVGAVAAWRSTGMVYDQLRKKHFELASPNEVWNRCMTDEMRAIALCMMHCVYQSGSFFSGYNLGGWFGVQDRDTKELLRGLTYREIKDAVKFIKKERKRKEGCKDNRSHVYLMIDRRNGLYKIGHSKNPKYRERTLQSQAPSVDLKFSTHFLADGPFFDARALEKALHDWFSDKRVRGEWFALNEDDVRYVIDKLAIFVAKQEEAL